MATVIKPSERQFRENAGRIDRFRLLTDIARAEKGINPDHLNFDVRQLPSGEYCAAYHFHRYAEELFIIISGSAILRTPDGLQTVASGDIVFFEKGAAGAHQLFNHTSEPCIYVDIRTYVGHDICEYPDSGKMYVIPTGEVFFTDQTVEYFAGEENIDEKWRELAHIETDCDTTL